jgi:hypothetical protein
MRLFEAVKSMFHRNAVGRPEKAQPRYDWKNVDRKCRIYRPAEIVNMLKEGQPFFKMASGGKYAVMVRRNKAGKEIPACFLRVDKDRRPRKERKRMKQMARTLAQATA